MITLKLLIGQIGMSTEVVKEYEARLGTVMLLPADGSTCVVCVRASVGDMMVR